MKKIDNITIFFDIDWVFNTLLSEVDEETWMDVVKGKINLFKGFIKKLREEYTNNVDLVMSSDWRMTEWYELFFSTFFPNREFKKTRAYILWELPEDLTSEEKEKIKVVNMEKIREMEIKQYIKENNIWEHIVIDDMNLEWFENFIKTRMAVWLTQKTIDFFLEEFKKK